MLNVEGLSFAYGKIQALTDISFTLNEGEVLAIIGSNGAGKSTLMKCIAGLLKPQAGKIEYRGEALPPQTHKVVNKGVTLVPEGRWIFPGLSVEDNLHLGGYTTKEHGPGIKRAYELFPRLGERRKQRAGTLSGGEQQMLAIARGLMAEPKLLMLDEPSLGLAPLIVNDIIRIIKDINSMGVSVLLVEQNARKALSIATHACVLDTGRVTKRGTGQELLNDESIIAAYLGGAGAKKKEAGSAPASEAPAESSAES
ncbi:ABC transporter ATP-binding protein [Oscillospiraceae bacterium OttesenSCG-928-G22]|nr:ABC transporter ATP-binding protein [Oscillospiraceae bacterium OttesenSCG-928-G22]